MLAELELLTEVELSAAGPGSPPNHDRCTSSSQEPRSSYERSPLAPTNMPGPSRPSLPSSPLPLPLPPLLLPPPPLLTPLLPPPLPPPLSRALAEVDSLPRSLLAELLALALEVPPRELELLWELALDWPRPELELLALAPARPPSALALALVDRSAAAGAL